MFLCSARESKATAEAELLSSTSEDVCELWGGNQVVRAYGVSNMQEFVIKNFGCTFAKIVDLPQAINMDWYGLYTNTGLFGRGKAFKIEVGPSDNIRGFKAPSITLNIKNAIISPSEIWIYALLGMLIQRTLAVYSWR